jgi:hypothetical protein
MTDIAKLRELEEKAIMGPWRTIPHPDGDCGLVGIGNPHSDSFGSAQITCYLDDAPANAALIAAMRNALPDLLHEVDRLIAVIQRGADLCERGHGHEWASEARAALQGASK